jgi:hypothetical protein
VLVRQHLARRAAASGTEESDDEAPQESTER